MDAAGRGTALAALFAGAAAIALSPLLVRVSEAGPVATGFWRVALALPVLWAWSIATARSAPHETLVGDRQLMIAAGVLFAGDLAVWHWSIMLTSVANATLLANLAPVFVTLMAWLFFRRRPGGVFLAGLAVALAGVGALLGGDFRLAGGELAGDCLGLLTALFYAGYIMTVAHLRTRLPTAAIMAWSGLVTAALLLPIAWLSGEKILPDSAEGWAKLAALALISQAAGQSLIAYAMARLEATFSSVGLLLQPVIAALLAWAWLGEALDVIEIIGGVAVLVGIYIAHAAGAERPEARSA